MEKSGPLPTSPLFLKQRPREITLCSSPQVCWAVMSRLHIVSTFLNGKHFILQVLQLPFFLLLFF